MTTKSTCAKPRAWVDTASLGAESDDAEDFGPAGPLADADAVKAKLRELRARVLDCEEGLDCAADVIRKAQESPDAHMDRDAIKTEIEEVKRIRAQLQTDARLEHERARAALKEALEAAKASVAETAAKYAKEFEKLLRRAPGQELGPLLQEKPRQNKAVATQQCFTRQRHGTLLQARGFLDTPFPSTLEKPGVKDEFQVFVYNSDGHFKRELMTKTGLLHATKLNARDLIHLDSGYHRRHRPILMVRPESILVSLAHVRAVICRDTVHLLHPEQPKIQRFAGKLAQFLRGERTPFPPYVFLGASRQSLNWREDIAADVSSTSEEGAQLPFELRALEGVLSHLCSTYYNRTRLLSPLVKSVLHTLSSRPVDPEVLHQLLPMKDTLSQFEIETTLTRNVLTEVLHNEEDMLAMLLSETYANSGVLPKRERHETVELLLENYCSQLIDISQEAYYLRKRVESTQSIIELRLDTYRNNMLRVSINIALASCALSLGTAISGIFGANLVNHLEDHPTAFYWLVLFSSVSVCGVFFGMRRKIPEGQAGGNLDSIFIHLEEIQQILSVARSRRRTGMRSLTRAELKAMLQKIAGVNISEEDLTIIWKTFDLDKDGTIEPGEIDKAILSSAKGEHRDSFISV
ncbi:Magnesium transporter MRS2, mitochondrial [Hondaea fermentalgiana]|uniref:Magnesium transporter n=1 Tax=Hondaea fermentalgiana TaxID=2315210 RepID=A0A2R5GXE5_9STRA|nr:Magnesium transporter MRS2, mitochondrial [Hondaea fermentalgiana]|eukprot:GBG33081.1 Magnesium transporter MRS2, mitochondrial [Hondaea fermentalgiana]